ncbi:L-cystine-binding protein FliY [Comamonadaceae bacterium OS-1]|nr:L-cystine-binding protein FliY [Comamonadaceae bacterium OS-1]
MLKKICAAVLCFGLAHAALADDLLDTIKSKGVVKIAMEGTYPPFNFKDAKTGALQGFDVDISNAIAAKLGVKPEFVATEWATILAGLQVGKYDLVVSQVTMTEKRAMEFDFSVPYTVSFAQIILRKDDKAEYANLDALKGKKVGAGQGSIYAETLAKVGGIDIKAYTSAPLNLQDLANGRIDAALNDRLLVPYMIQEAKLPLRPSTVLLDNPQKQGIAFRKGSPKLKDALDKALGELVKDGSYAKISMKWFGVDASK